jgi:hypothetical protein
VGLILKGGITVDGSLGIQPDSASLKLGQFTVETPRLLMFTNSNPRSNGDSLSALPVED